MNGWLVDTNVLSELRRQRPDRHVVEFISQQPLDSLFVSTVTFAEIRFGIETIADPARRSDLNTWLSQLLRPMFRQRVLEVTEDVMLRWRLLVEAGRKSRHTFSQPDLIIAATALHHDLTVVTRDTSEFIEAGAAVLNPWVEQ